jgi:hypothetical protein
MKYIHLPVVWMQVDFAMVWANMTDSPYCIYYPLSVLSGE